LLVLLLWKCFVGCQLPVADWTHLLPSAEKLSMCPFYCFILFYIFRFQNDNGARQKKQHAKKTKQTFTRWRREEFWKGMGSACQILCINRRIPVGRVSLSRIFYTSLRHRLWLWLMADRNMGKAVKVRPLPCSWSHL